MQRGKNEELSSRVHGHLHSVILAAEKVAEVMTIMGAQMHVQIFNTMLSYRRETALQGALLQGGSE